MFDSRRREALHFAARLVIAGGAFARVPAASANPAGTGDRAEGEVRRIDATGRKLTIRHGELRQLGMPPMTMSFSVDGAMPAGLKVGQRIRFTARDAGGTLTASEIELLK